MEKLIAFFLKVLLAIVQEVAVMIGAKLLSWFFGAVYAANTVHQVC